MFKQSALVLLIIIVAVTLIQENEGQNVTISNCTNTNIQQVINNTVSGSTIYFSCGNITVPISTPIWISKSLIIDGNNQVTFDGQSLSRLVVIAKRDTNWGFDATNIAVTLKGIKLFRGLGSPVYQGERACSTSGCWGSLTGNKIGKKDGAGIYIGSGGTVTLDGVEIDSCVTEGTTVNTGDNRPPNDITYLGGAIMTLRDVILTISNSQIKNSTALQGGGIYASWRTNAVNINNGLFANNIATQTGEAGGGAIRLHETSATITSSTFSGNKATLGAAIHNLLSDLFITSTTFAQNIATSRGAIYIDGAGPLNPNRTVGQINFNNASFLDNNSTSKGGAVYVCLYNSTTQNDQGTLTDCSFCRNLLTGNFDVSGAAIRYDCSGFLSLVRPVFAGNGLLNQTANPNPSTDTVGVAMPSRLSVSGGAIPARGQDSASNITYCNGQTFVGFLARRPLNKRPKKNPRF